jgi:hypothetical protein
MALTLSPGILRQRYQAEAHYAIDGRSAADQFGKKPLRTFG